METKLNRELGKTYIRAACYYARENHLRIRAVELRANVVEYIEFANIYCT